MTCLTLVAAITAAGLVGARAAERSADFHEDLVGIIVAKREVATLLVLADGDRFWLPLKEFASLISIEVISTSKSQGARIKTPYGEVAIPLEYVKQRPDGTYVDQRFFQKRLNTHMHFDEEASALAVRPPWHARRNAGDQANGLEELVPEVRPPSYGLATIHGDTYYETQTNQRDVWHNALRATGFAYGGVWQVNYFDDIYGERRLSDAIWMKQLDDHRMIQIGHQNVALHPVLRSLELTGVQWAWSSKPIVTDQAALFPGALLERRGRPQRTFAGEGPIGGFAELWVNGRRIERRNIGLSGTYEFVDVILPDRQSSIEIRIYDHHNPSAPIEIIEDTMLLSDLLLERSQINVLTGVGAAGNSFDRLSSYRGERRERPAGFAIARYGVSDTTTLEGILRVHDTEAQIAAGVVSQLRAGVFTSLAVAAQTTGHVGYDAEVSWTGTDAKAFLKSHRRLPRDGYNYYTHYDHIDWRRNTDWRHEARYTFYGWDTFEVGVTAQYDPIRWFIGPFVAWRPNSYMSFRVLPDYTGRYRLDAHYRATPVDHFFATVNYDQASLVYTRHMESEGLSLTAELGYDRRHDDFNAALGLAGNTIFDRNISWRAAATYAYGGLGFDLSLRRQIAPGVIAYVDASQRANRYDYYDYYAGYDYYDRKNDDLRIRVGLGFDLAIGREGVLPASRRGVRPDIGSLAGVVAPGATGDDRKGIPIIVDGRIAGRTSEGGKFYIPEVKRGIHVVEFDDEKLPIEHVAKKRSIVAEVAPGAVTSMRFSTEVQYGLAGQVKDRSGNAVAGATLAIVDAAGKQVAELQSNDFGYYRSDGLVPGRYTIKASAPGSSNTTGHRNISITNDHVFGVDLTLGR